MSIETADIPLSAARQSAIEQRIASAVDQVARHPTVAAAHYELGRLLAEAGRHKDAERCFVRCLKIAPDNADARHDLGVVLRAQGRFDDALACYNAALALEPTQSETWVNIGLLHAALGRRPLAEAAFRSALAVDPGSVKAWNSLGLFLQEQGRDDDAAAAFRAAIDLAPDAAAARFNLASLQERQGASDEAAALYRETLGREPGHALARANLVELAGADDPVIAETSAILEQQAVGSGDRALLHYALAKHFDRHSAYKQAWHHAASANQLRRSMAGSFDADEHRQLATRLADVFSPEFLDQRRQWGRCGKRALFIVGLPRSGTTLLEQILASHPQVQAGGEIEHFALYGQDYPRLFDLSSTYPECLGELTVANIATLADAYLAHLAAIDGDADFVTNKTPLNFMRIGLIKLLFPDALFLHCRRDPRDSLLSIYFHNFAVHQTFATDLGSLGQYYLGYRQVMANWQSLFPDAIMDVDYRRMTDDPEASIRRVLDFVGLPWNDACLAFHKTRRRIDTPSLHQVRKPIYKTSVARWKNYRDELQPLLDVLGPVAEDGV